MRFLPRRGAAAVLTLSPGPLRATETVTATVAVEEPIEKIRSARLELGYVNTYRYRWAGRHDAAAKFDDSSLLTMGQVGTDYGSERETSDWVAVLDEPLPVVAGVLRAGSHRVGLRVPSWAPGSSHSTVRWEVRLRIERAGRDIEAEEAFQVLVAAPDPPPEELPLVQAEQATLNTIEWDITTAQTCYRPGDTVTGTITMTPREAVERDGELAVYFLTHYTSHPLERTPGSLTESRTRPPIVVAEGVRLVQGSPTAVPFAAQIPDDVDPTTEAVHSSLDVFLLARFTFSGLTGGLETARRGIVVHTA